MIALDGSHVGCGVEGRRWLAASQLCVSQQSLGFKADGSTVHCKNAGSTTANAIRPCAQSAEPTHPSNVLLDIFFCGQNCFLDVKELAAGFCDGKPQKACPKCVIH